MDLLDAFLIKKGRIITLVGAGGKTTTMFSMGEEALKRCLRVVITTTTRIFMPPDEESKPVVLARGTGILRSVGEKLKKCPLVVAGAGVTGENKIVGVDKAIVPGFLEAGADIVMVEADGAAGRPFKAPKEGEPVIPGESDLVVPLVGLDCLGKPLDHEYVHRPEIISELTGIGRGGVVTPAVVAGVYLHPMGYFKDVPSGCRWIPFINKVETDSDLRLARELADLLGRGGAERVVIGAARDKDPVREVMVY
ncbi:MAG: selenium cofactor biosynthesis protein YqeC [Bacillota bacterium]